MTPVAAAIRDVTIAGPSARRELLAVVRAGMTVAFLTWLYLASSPFAAGGDASKRTLLPYQAFIRDRPSEDQLMFRELQVALIEAEAVRSATSNWPSPAALSADGIEPFAKNPAIKGPAYTWTTSREGRTINYLGLPASEGPAWLVWVQEPDPAAPEVFRADEEHHQLLDGSVLHVSLWSRSDALRVDGGRVIQAPQFSGWTQLYAVSVPPGHTIAPAR